MTPDKRLIPSVQLVKHPLGYCACHNVHSTNIIGNFKFNSNSKMLFYLQYTPKIKFTAYLELYFVSFWVFVTVRL